MNFSECVELMKEGKKVRRKSWDDKYCIKYLYKTAPNNFTTSDNELYMFFIDDFEADDWEEYHEPKTTLSDKGITFCDYNKNTLKQIGYAKEDVKEALKEFMKRGKGTLTEKQFEYTTFYKEIKEIFGKELLE